VSTNTASRVISWLLPAFYTRIRYISWPKEFQISSFEGVVGSIDGTCHFRNRIHPRSGDLYRGDKHAHFIGAQVVCGLDGKFFSVMLTLGHNNDSGAIKLTGMSAILKESDIKLLADSGYPLSNINLVTPDKSISVAWNNKQKRLRSMIEKSIGLGKAWALLYGDLITHEISILLCYEIAQFHHFPN